MKKIFAVGAVFAVIVKMFAGCGAETGNPELPVGGEPGYSTRPSVDNPEYKRITPHEAREMMCDDVIVLDVRAQEEFDRGHIENALLLPHDRIREEAGSILPDKNQTVLVYCQSGRRSEIASRELVDMGYTKVFDFGGIINWPGEIVS